MLKERYKFIITSLSIEEFKVNIIISQLAQRTGAMFGAAAIVNDALFKS